MLRLQAKLDELCRVQPSSSQRVQEPRRRHTPQSKRKGQPDDNRTIRSLGRNYSLIEKRQPSCRSGFPGRVQASRTLLADDRQSRNKWGKQAITRNIKGAHFAVG